MEAWKDKAKTAGLWNLFMPVHALELAANDFVFDCPGLTNLEYAPLAEIMGANRLRLGGVQLLRARHRQHGGARALRRRGEQQEQWLRPLMNGEIRSAFLMTEPAVASSGRHQHRDPHRARRRRLCDQRPQMVVVGRRRSALQDHDRDGQDRSGRRHASPASR